MLRWLVSTSQPLEHGTGNFIDFVEPAIQTWHAVQYQARWFLPTKFKLCLTYMNWPFTLSFEVISHWHRERWVFYNYNQCFLHYYAQWLPVSSSTQNLVPPKSQNIYPRSKTWCTDFHMILLKLYLSKSHTFSALEHW